MKKMSKYIKIGLLFIFVNIVTIITTDIVVSKSNECRLYDNVDLIPNKRVGLLLGTSKYRAKGRINLYYQNRIDAAVSLYNAGKVEFILVSGDNRQKEYNEPKTIKKDLVAYGIPSSKIFLDYAGFRTYDSVIRAKKVFGQTSIVVISQEFHNERALFIASKYGIDAIGFNAKCVGHRYGLKTQIRERFARVKMVFDLISNKQPKFLGDKIIIK